MENQLVAIAIGLIVSLIVTECLGLSVGGMIVPGYIALSLHQPIAVLLTIVAAAATWGLVRIVSQYAMLFGRRRVVMTVMIGFTVGMAFRGLAEMFFSHAAVGSMASEAANPVVMIGFIIPGLIALWFERQGLIETLSPMMSAAVLVRLVLILVGVETLV
ncbi:poly-gamma-glutamate biosynthesis protein PgsC [Rubripirellula reticaptiva]|uniref:Capsule biosynthesis protein CapC n=1 Tax=Rubripirellula reticaptiva TaxID=2528013 RepID=A0A5C6EP78_9BACT|nr:poly-gamma-glutamate biosynthesis protein PgsC [Rubripirellula reticaptiva]TWU49817.1 Capsule biosynthesis protein CapC [Rubripirellula reticaptiva]